MPDGMMRIQDVVVRYGMSLVAALLIFLIGRWAARLIARVTGDRTRVIVPNAKITGDKITVKTS